MEIALTDLPAVDQALIAAARDLATHAPVTIAGDQVHRSLELAASPVEGLPAEVAGGRPDPDHDWEIDFVLLIGDRTDGGPEQFLLSDDGTRVTPAFWIHEDSSEVDSAAAELLTRAYLAQDADQMLQTRTQVKAAVDNHRHGNPSKDELRSAVPAAAQLDF